MRIPGKQSPAIANADTLLYQVPVVKQTLAKSIIFSLLLLLSSTVCSALVVSSATSLNDWQQLRCGTLSDLGNGTLKLYGTDYRQGNTIVSRVLYDFTQGSETKIKFMPDGAGDFSYVYAGITGVAGVSGTTNSTWDGSLLLPGNTWYYARIVVNKDRTWSSILSTGNYDSAGGSVMASKHGTLSDIQWVNAHRNTIRVDFGDNYAGTSASVRISEATTTAASFPVPSGTAFTYNFNDGQIPKDFRVVSGAWSVTGGTLKLSTTGNQSSDIELPLNPANGIPLQVSFKVKTDFNLRDWGWDNSFNFGDVSSSSTELDGYSWQNSPKYSCWMDVSFPIPEGTETLRWRYFENNYYSGYSSPTNHTVAIDDIRVLYTATNTPPTASFTATPASGTAPLAVSLDASASSDPDGSIASYAWSTSDGQNTSGKSAFLTFAKAGTYTITLTVTDDKGATNSTAKTVKVTAATGATVTDVNPKIAVLNQPTVFTVTGTNLAAGMGFTVGDCEHSNYEMESSSTTERYFKCTQYGTVGVKQGIVKTSPGGTDLFRFEVNAIKKSIPNVYINTNKSVYKNGDILEVYVSSYQAEATKDVFDVYIEYDGPSFSLFSSESGLTDKAAPAYSNVSIPSLGWIDMLKYKIVPETPAGTYSAKVYLIDKTTGQVVSISSADFTKDNGGFASADSLVTPAPIYSGRAQVVGSFTEEKKCGLAGIDISTSTGTGVDATLDDSTKQIMRTIQMGSQFNLENRLATIYNGAKGAYNLLVKGEELCKKIDYLTNVSNNYWDHEFDDSLTEEQKTDLFAIDLATDLLSWMSNGFFHGDIYGVSLKNLKGGIREIYNASNKSLNLQGLLTGSDGSTWNVGIKFSTPRQCFFCSRPASITLTAELTPIYIYDINADSGNKTISTFPKIFTNSEAIKTAKILPDTTLGKSVTASSNGGKLSFQLHPGFYLIKAYSTDGEEVFRDTIHFIQDNKVETMTINRK